MTNELIRIATKLQLVDNISEKIDFLNEYALKMRVENPNLALSLVQQAQTLASDLEELYPVRIALSKQIEGFCLWRLRDYAAAHSAIHKTLSIFEEHEDFRNHSYSLFLMGNIQLRIEQIDNALHSYTKAAAIAEQIGDEQRRADSYAQMGKIHWRTGHYTNAFTYLHQALALYTSIKALPQQADTNNNIGLVYMGIKQYKEALQHYKQALQLYRTLGEPQGEANAWANIGIAFEQLGRTRKALRYCYKALSLRRKLQDREGEANSLNTIGRIHMDFGNKIRALRYFIQSLELYEETDNKYGQSPALNNIGHLYWNLEDYQNAFTYFQKSLALQEEINDQQGQALSLLNIGGVYRQWKQYDKALGYVVRSAEIFRDIGDRGGEAKALDTLGSIYTYCDDFDSARDCIFRSIAIVQEIGMKYEEALFFITLAQYQARQHAHDEAITTLTNAYTIADNIQAHQLLSTIHQELASIYEQSHNFQLAYKHVTAFHALKERIANADIARKIKAMDLSFEVARTRRQNTSYRKKNTELATLLQEVAVLNDHLQKVNEEKNELLGIVAHDLQNPLCSILILSRLLRDDPALSTTERDEFITNIITTVSRMSDLISRLLNINALEQGHFTIAVAPHDIADTAASVVHTYQQQAQNKNISLHFAHESHCIATADAHALMQILDNLVSNAIKFSPRDKNIYIRVYSQQDTVYCSVRDEGPGLSEEDQKRLFGKFARLSAQPTGGEHSSGLGLSVVKKLAEAMNSTVWCDSKHGHGATFVVAMPAALHNHRAPNSKETA